MNKNLDRLAQNRKWTLPALASAMNAAGTQDVRTVDTVPLLARLLAGSPAPDPRAAKSLQLLKAWSASGGSRLDRDLNGTIDDPGAAVMDVAWPKIADAAMGPVLDPQLDELNTLVPRFDLPPKGQYPGWYQYLDKDLHTLLGDKVAAPDANRFCGNGDKAACQKSIWAAIDAAGAQLQASRGSNPAGWHSDAKAERITCSSRACCPPPCATRNGPPASSK